MELRKFLDTDSYYVPNFISTPSEFFERLQEEIDYVPRSEMKVKRTGTPIRRDKAFYSIFDSSGNYPIYKYPGYDKILHKPKPFTPVLEEIRAKLKEFTGQDCNHCVINRYINGSDNITPHYDKYKNFAEGLLLFETNFYKVLQFSLSRSVILEQ